MPADIFVYALVAAGLIFWLRNVLGTRHGDEREQSDPLLHALEKQVEAQNEQMKLNDNEAATPQDRIMALAANPTSVVSVDNKTAENGLIEISKADKSFDIDFFINGAQDAFAIIVEAFAKGERDTLKDLLNDEVFAAFEGAITEREKLGHTQETEIHSIRRAEIIEAKLQDKMAFVTVRFKADETSVLKDESGEILEGHPDKTTEMRDIWTFGRDVKSRDPRWIVYETRGDFDGDNDLIPDTH